MKPLKMLFIIVLLFCLAACAGTPVIKPPPSEKAAVDERKSAPVQEQPGQSLQELSVEEFLRQLIAALGKKENEKAAKLIMENPNTAEKARAMMEKAGEGEGENAQIAKKLAGILSEALKILEGRAESGKSSEEVEMNRLQEQGEQAYYRAEYTAAIEKWRQGLEMAKKSGNQKYISQFIGNLGVVYADLGQYEKALSYYEQSLAIKREIGDRSGEGGNLTNLGVVYDDLGQYEKALSYYEQALVIHREIGDRREGRR